MIAYAQQLTTGSARGFSDLAAWVSWAAAAFLDLYSPRRYPCVISSKCVASCRRRGFGFLYAHDKQTGDIIAKIELPQPKLN
jgi:hypothetical protein